MRIAFDSSALAKRYLAEPGTERLLELCAAADEVILSVLCVLEILSALNRLRRDGHLSDEQYLGLKEDLAKDVRQATVVTVTGPVLGRTTELLETTSLRTLDAVHVATALESSCDLFVSADRRQSEAARRSGLAVEEIVP